MYYEQRRKKYFNRSCRHSYTRSIGRIWYSNAKNIESTTVDDNIDKVNDSLSFGSKGKDVKAIQMYMNTACSSELKKNNLYPLELNGIWDEETEKATVYCSALQRNTIDSSTLKTIKRDLKNSKIN